MARCVVIVAFVIAAFPAFAQEGPPVIKKLGTVECDMVETTPIVFNGKLYRFEYVRNFYYTPNTTGKPYFRFRDIAAGEYTPAFAEGYHLGSAFVDGDTVYAFGVEEWGAPRMAVFWSKDMKEWQSRTILDLPGWEIFNNGVCKGPDGYVMAFEIGAPPEETGNGFTTRFARSKDLLNWELTPPECVWTKERYSACPAIAYVDGFYYMIYLESHPGFYAPHIVRSRDLIQWEESPYNPIMKHGDEDRAPVGELLSAEDKERIKTAANLNNSDVDICEFEGKTVIYYSWGNQQGVEHLAEAVYDGPADDFLKGWFPEKQE